MVSAANLQRFVALSEAARRGLLSDSQLAALEQLRQRLGDIFTTERRRREPEGQVYDAEPVESLQEFKEVAEKAAEEPVTQEVKVVHQYEKLPDDLLNDLLKKDELEKLREELIRRFRGDFFVSDQVAGAGEGIQYMQVTQADYTVKPGRLLRNGITIFGVDYPGPVTIRIPKPKPTQIVYVNDESGNAGANPITVTTIQA